MRRLFSLLLLLALLSFTGCMHSVRLSKRAVVQTAGFDYRDGEYTATLLLYGLPGGAPGTAQTVRARGQTLTALFADAATRQGKQLFLGNLRLIVFGSSLSVEGIDDAMQFLNGYHQLSPATQIAVSLGDAAELLNTGESKPQSGELLDILTNAQKSGTAPVCRLMDLVAPDHDRAVPVLLRTQEQKEQAPSASSESGAGTSSGAGEGASSGKSQSQGSEAPTQAVSAGAVIFSGGRAASYLTLEMTRGLCWLQNNLRAAVLETQAPLSAAVTRKVSRRIMPELLADNAVFNIELELRSTLIEAPEDARVYSQIAGEQERIVSRDVQRFLDASLRQGLDPLDWAQLLRRRAPELLRSHDARALLQNAGYDIRVRCAVDRNGAASP